MFTWHLLDHQTIIWPSPDPSPDLNVQFTAQKKLYGGGWLSNPLQTLSQGLVLMIRFTFDPDLSLTKVVFFPRYILNDLVSGRSCNWHWLPFYRHCPLCVLEFRFKHQTFIQQMQSEYLAPLITTYPISCFHGSILVSWFLKFNQNIGCIKCSF